MNASRQESDRAGSGPRRLSPPRPGWPAALLAALALAAAVVLVYLPALDNEFLNFDDRVYVRDNTNVHELSASTIHWALTDMSQASNWHPLTWISHAVDCELYGKDLPWGHHLSNVLLHALNGALVLLVLWRLTGRLWPSAAVAALFALHPLRVEAVAWISQRKELLCTAFILLTLLAYAAYAREPSPRPFWFRRSYWLVLAAFAAALMSKPMAVTLPFALLLLDWWPLKRLSWRAVVEKAPLVALSAAGCVLTVLAQTAGGATRTLTELPLVDRLGNFAVGYARYLAKVFWPWPGNLLPYYPLAGAGGPPVTPLLVGAALCLLAVISVAVILLRRRHPYLLVGCLWFGGTLIPVAGLVQVGQQSMADRYTYLPAIGLMVGVVWLVSDLASGRLLARRAAAIAALALLAVLAGLTLRQERLWRSPVSLWQSVARAFPQNAVAANSLGASLWNRQGADRLEALDCFRRAVELKPDWTNAHLDYAKALATLERYDEALEQFQATLKLAPDSYEARTGMALLLERLGDVEGAEREYRLVLRDHPDLWLVHAQLGDLLEKRGRAAEAGEHYAEAERLRRLGPAARRP